MLISEIIYNLAALVSLSLLAWFIKEDDRPLWLYQTLQGFIFGAAAIIGMLHPLVYAPGLIFDGRSVMISLGGLFFGPIAAAVAALMAILCRFSQGGVGMWMGITVIAASALIGAFFYFQWVHRKVKITIPRLWIFGFWVHAAMLLATVTLPSHMVTAVFKQIAWPVIIAYPLATILIGQILLDIAERRRVEEALRETNDIFSLFMQHSPVYTYIKEVTSTKSRVLQASDNFKDMVGISGRDMIGKAMEEIFEPEFAAKITADDQRVMDQGQVLKIEEELNGRFYTTIKFPIVRGRKNLLAGYTIDITESKKADEAIRAERNLLQSVMDAAKNSHLVHLDCDFNFVHVNEAYAKTCGYRAEEMIGKNHFALYPNDENKAIFTQVRDTGVMFEVHDKPFEFPNQPERGITYWDWVLTPIKDDGGKVIGLVFSLYETTARKRIEGDLKRQNNLFMSLLQNLSVGVFMVEAPSGRPLVANEAARRILGRGILPDVSSQNLAEIYKAYKAGTRESYPLDEMPVLRGMLGETTHVEDMMIVRPDGTQVVLEVFGSPVVDDQGKVLASLVSFSDITLRKKAEDVLRRAKEDAEAASKAKGEFLNNIAHDFRTPMHAIMGFSSRLQAEDLTAQQKRYVNIIHDRSKILLGLVEDLLDASRLDAGKVALRAIEFDIKECVLGVSDMAQVGLADKDVKMDCIFQENIPRLKGDVVRFSQVLLNLIGNAVKYTDKGTIVVKVDQVHEGVAADKCRIRISVKDTGFGIPLEKQPMIFDAFTRFHEFEGDRERGGTGLGLYITKTLVDLMGGQINLSSQEGAGSDFVVLLDFDRAA